MNAEWYGMLLRLLNDLGYDTSKVKYIDWDNIPEEYADYFDNIACELENVLYLDKFKNCHSPQLTFDRIIPDCRCKKNILATASDRKKAVLEKYLC